MSLIINNIALNFLDKKEASNEVVLKTAADVLEVNDKISDFVESIHHIYNTKGSKAYGFFSEQSLEPVFDEDGQQIEAAPAFSQLLSDYLDNAQQFAFFSQQGCLKLKTELEKYDLAETGYLLLCHYEHLGGQYLLVALLPISEHFYVDGELNISADKHLDTNKLQLAARIDLVDLKQQPERRRYISFIKGRAGRKVNDFFLDFLNCEEGVDPKAQTQTLVSAVEEYVDERQFDPEEKQQARKELLNYCKEQKSAGKELSLKEIAQSIPKEEEENDFYQFCQQQDYPLEESFPHEQSVVNKVTKYSGYGNGISISFERSHFGKDVIYNPMNDTLTIHKVPPNLKEQLLKLLSTAQTD
jgi:nucleoid-associated protein